MAKKKPESPILQAIRAATQSEAAAVAFFEAARWGDSPACPRCGDINVYQMQDSKTGGRERNFRWRCRGCKRMYTVRTGLVLEETRLPLRVWAHAFWRASASKKGVSALQIKRECQISYKSALFLMHRIRYAMATDWTKRPKLSGTVEVDEAYIGGKPRYKKNMPLTAQYPHLRKKWSEKAPVVALVQRDGDVRVRHIERVDARTLRSAVYEEVERGSTIYTDENQSYKKLGRDGRYHHDTVQHSLYEYARGPVSTNTVEAFFGLLKRAIYGTFHSVSKHHLHRYLSEAEFKWNTRKLDDGERALEAIRGAEGKRLLYTIS